MSALFDRRFSRGRITRPWQGIAGRGRCPCFAPVSLRAVGGATILGRGAEGPVPSNSPNTPYPLTCLATGPLRQWGGRGSILERNYIVLRS